MERVYFVRTKRMIEIEMSHSLVKMPFERTLVEKTKENISYDDIRQKYENKGYDVLWIERMRRIAF